MARATTTNQQISGVYTAHQNQTRFSMAGWMNRLSSGSHQFFGFGDNNNNWLGPYHFTDNVMYFLLGANSNSFGSSTQNVTGWNHWAMTFDGSQTGSASRLRGYLNGVQLTLSFPSGAIPATTSNLGGVANNFRIGRIAYNNQWSVGQFAELAMWQETLSANDVASLAKGISPHKIRPDVLVSHIPLVRDVLDIKSGITLTDSSTTAAAHPRVYK